MRKEICRNTEDISKLLKGKGGLEGAKEREIERQLILTPIEDERLEPFIYRLVESKEMAHNVYGYLFNSNIYLETFLRIDKESTRKSVLNDYIAQIRVRMDDHELIRLIPKDQKSSHKGPIGICAVFGDIVWFAENLIEVKKNVYPNTKYVYGIFNELFLRVDKYSTVESICRDYDMQNHARYEAHHR